MAYRPPDYDRYYAIQAGAPPQGRYTYFIRCDSNVLWQARTLYRTAALATAAARRALKRAQEGDPGHAYEMDFVVG